MLKISDFPIIEAQKIFTSKSIDVAFLVPTETGIKKSIMDATKTLRFLLNESKIHDFESQKQGVENKVIMDAYFVYNSHLERTKVSLYRPNTKNGDPRIWFYGLNNYCKKGNLLTIFTDKKMIFVLNISRIEIFNSIKENGFVDNLLNSVSEKINEDKNKYINELLMKLKVIHQTGFHKTVVDGDSGVGMTLEHLLGIKVNSSKAPDYKGIEIKCNRNRVKKENRSVLFSQSPNWNKSVLKSGLEIINRCGYVKDGVQRLYCTVKVDKPNAQGLILEVDNQNDVLRSKVKVIERFDEVAIWELETLKDRLLEKHNNTFWISAESRFVDGHEEFLYKDVIFTQSPSVIAFVQLLEESIISLDFLIKKYNETTKDHGYLFKIKKSNLDLLFPPSIKYDLSKPQNI